MKVLFVSSGNAKSKSGISPIIKSQGESLRKEGIDIQYFPINGRGWKGYFSSLLELRKVTKSSDFDLIHAHYGLAALIAFFAKRRMKIVVSFMGDDLVGSNDFNGNVKFFSRVIVFINKLFAKYFFDFNIVKSKEMFEVLKLANSSIISNGVDFNSFYEIDRIEARNFLRIDLNLKQILFCSNPNRPEKNYSLAEEAVKLINEKNIELKYLHDVDQKELVYHYNAADCLILTSYHEGSPNVIKEAMACNVPIISTNVGDVSEVISKTNGCYITSFQPKDVVDKISKAIYFGNRTTGRKDIEHLEASVVAKRIIDIYNEILVK